MSWIWSRRLGEMMTRWREDWVTGRRGYWGDWMTRWGDDKMTGRLGDKETGDEMKRRRGEKEACRLNEGLLIVAIHIWYYLFLKKIRFLAIHELPLQSVFLWIVYFRAKAHLFFLVVPRSKGRGLNKIINRALALIILY